MIRLEVKDYCQNCSGFEADVVKPGYWLSNMELNTSGDTIIRCDHHTYCARIYDYAKKENDNGKSAQESL